MSGIGGYSGSVGSSGDAKAPTLNFGSMSSYSPQINQGTIQSSNNYQTQNSHKSNIIDYDGVVDYNNSAIGKEKEDTLDLNTFIEDDLEKGKNVLTEEKKEERGSTKIDSNAKTKTIQESKLKEEPKQNIFQKGWSWLKKTGATVAKTGETIIEKVGEGIETAAATVFVTGTTAAKGGVSLLEGFVDNGMKFFADGLDLIGANSTADSIRETANKNVTDKLYDDFYQSTELGKSINEESLIKSDGILVNAVDWISNGINKTNETILEVLNSTACSVANGAVGLLEGVAELGEGLIDTVAVLGGGVVSVPLLLADGVSWLGSKITGSEFESVTKQFWLDDVMPAVGVDLSGKAFDALYETEFMQGVDSNAVGFMKRGGVGYDVMKNVGYVTATVALGVATGGMSTTALTASQASTLVAGLAKAGNKFESGYNKAAKDGEVTMGEVGAVLGNGALAGTIEAGTWFMTYGNGLSKVGEKIFGQGATEALKKSLFGFKSGSALGKLFPNAVKIETLVKSGIQFGKSWANYAADILTIGSSKSAGDVLTESFINAGTSIIYDTSIIKTWAENIGASASSKITGKDYAYEGHPIVEQGHDELLNLGETTAKLPSNLAKAISELRYASNDTQANWTRLIFEGLKKSGGNLVKKWITEPLKEAFN